MTLQATALDRCPRCSGRLMRELAEHTDTRLFCLPCGWEDGVSDEPLPDSRRQPKSGGMRL